MTISSSTARAAHRDVVVRLATPDELFMTDSRRLLSGSGRLLSGMDELVDRFLAQKKIRSGQRIVVDLAASDGRADLSGTIGSAIHRYCGLRMEQCQRQRRVIWRQGLRSLKSGFLLFFVGVVLSYAFTRPDAPDFWRELLGDGVFLVVAWVGLWYPLDLLFIARQPLRREITVLAAMQSMPVVVRAGDEPVPPLPGPEPIGTATTDERRDMPLRPPL